MIFETKIIEITQTEILLMVISSMILGIILVAIFLYIFLSSKIHDSYHKGYNKAKSDKVQYYATLKTLIDDFKEIILNLKKDNIRPSIISTNLLIEFKQSLKDYYNI